MRCRKGLNFFLVGAACGAADAGIIYGPDAKAYFAAMQAEFNEVYLDFESVAAGTNLMPGADPFGVGARFASIINTNGTPFGPEHVEVSNLHGYTTYGNTIVGSPYPFGNDDGRVGYEIRFDTPQYRAGILRAWNTSALTRFYNADGVLLGEHQNTVGAEFVGWVADSSDPSTWVARMVMDGLVLSGTRQVGYSDDLYFGVMVPSPTSAGVIVLGLTAFKRRR